MGVWGDGTVDYWRAKWRQHRQDCAQCARNPLTAPAVCAAGINIKVMFDQAKVEAADSRAAAPLPGQATLW